eukprot:COSAG05_NODE_13374_length_433_cov_0.547904_2_plen_56_part_01
MPFFHDPTRLSFPTSRQQGTRNKTLAYSQYPHSTGNSGVLSCPFFRDGGCYSTPST